MALMDELRKRLKEYEAEAVQMRPRLQRLEELIPSVKLLLAEEEKTSTQYSFPIVPTGNAPPESQSVSTLVVSLLAPGATLRFNQIRDAVREQKYPAKDTILVGKLVNGVLRRAVETGKVERLSRGLYRRRNGTTT